MDARGFNRELQRFIAKDVKAYVLKRYKQILNDLGTSIVRDTPVDTGSARANWRFTTSGVSSAYNRDARDPGGSKAIGRLKAAVAGITIQQPLYISNNAPYIEKLEYGWSKQAPAGMLAKNIARVRSKYRVL